MKKTTDKGFEYKTPDHLSDPIIKTGLATMGGQHGSKFGLTDPDSQGTTLLAKINGYFFGFFQAGDEWGKSLGIKNIERKTDKETVHAEEYFLAALRDTWDFLLDDGIIKKDESPSITLKITKTPCSGCAPQLVDFVSKEKDCNIRIKAAQLWGHRSNQFPHNVTALNELGKAGVTVIPWNLLSKLGKSRKSLTKHELADLSDKKFDEEDVKRLENEYNTLRESLGLEDDDLFQKRLKDYKGKGVSKETMIAILKETAPRIIESTTLKLEKMEFQLTGVNNALDKAKEPSTRKSPRKTVQAETAKSRARKINELSTKKQKKEENAEALKKTKELYQDMVVDEK
ncbi:MAG: hypothetical protein JO170_23835 [Verrucomicrobia bacterium]|nr:hypothetical protein [Verrucomicrobiota bacterium]